MKEVKVKPKFTIGDIVRVSLDKRKNPFARSYDLQNSYAKYEIYKISTTPVPGSEVAECRHSPWRRCPAPVIPGLVTS